MPLLLQLSADAATEKHAVASLPTVTVTAKRLADSGDEAGNPLVVRARELRERNLADLSSLASELPNVAAQPGGLTGLPQFAIRGVQSPVGGAVVALVVDDAPIQVRPSAFNGNVNIELFDLDQVEVLRGPQSTELGGAALGGAIKLWSSSPDPLAFSSDRRVAATLSTARSRLSAASSIVLIPDRLSSRVASVVRHDRGFVDHVDPLDGRLDRNVDASDTVAARLTLDGALTDGWFATVKVLGQESWRHDLPISLQASPYRQSFVRRQPGRDQLVLTTAAVEGSIGGATAKVNLSFFARDGRQLTDYSPVFGELVLGGTQSGLVPEGGSGSLVRDTQRSWNVQAKIVWRHDRWSLLAGVHGSQTALRIRQDVDEPGIAELLQTYVGADVQDLFGVPLLSGGRSYSTDERTSETQRALFVEGAFMATSRLKANAGVRVSHTRVTVSAQSSGPYSGNAAPAITTETEADWQLAPRASVSWQLSEALALRAETSRGFRTGGGNSPISSSSCAADLNALGRDSAPLRYRSDSLWNHQLGADWSNDRLSLKATAFRIDWADVAQNITLPGCGFSYVDNLGQARNQGIELELTLVPVDALTIHGDLGEVDARYRRTLTIGNATLVRRGERLAFVPRWTAHASGEWRQRIRSRATLIARGDVVWRGDYQGGSGPGTVGYIPETVRGAAVTEVGTSLGIERNRWSVELFVDNLLDAKTVLYRSVDLVPITRNPVRTIQQQPRFAGFRLRYH